jgi:hypothetical protein
VSEVIAVEEKVINTFQTIAHQLKSLHTAVKRLLLVSAHPERWLVDHLDEQQML